MRNHPVDIINSKVVHLHHLCNVVAHVGHGITEHGASLLMEVVQTVVHRKLRRRTNRATCLHVKEGQTLAVRTHVRIDNADILLFCCLQEHCSGTVAEEHTSRAVLIIDE